MSHPTMSVGEELDYACRAAGLDIVGVSIGDPDNKSPWQVQPASLQSEAQPIIDDFNHETVHAAYSEVVAETLVADPVIASLIEVLSDVADEDVTAQVVAAIKTKL